MNKRLQINHRAALVLSALLVLTSAQAPAESASPSPAPAANAPFAGGRPTYDSFKLVHTRNVFDPDRRPIRSGANTPAPTTPTQADYAALTGTMLSGEKSYAFFSGSRPEFNKVLSVQDKFANASIAAITGQSVEIERDGKRTTVLVGQTVPFDNQTAPGEPPADVAAPVDTSASVSGDASARTSSPAGGTPSSTNAYRPATGPAAYTRPTGGTAAGAPPSSSPKGPPANIDEIRRRMMEKRQQELK